MAHQDVESIRWDQEQRSTLTAMLCEALKEACRPPSRFEKGREAEKRQSNGQGKVKALLAAFSAAGGSAELSKAATAGLMDLTLLGGGSVSAAPIPSGDQAVAWAVGLLARCGASVNEYDDQGWAPIHQQACMGHRLAVEALLFAGAHAGQPAKPSAGLPFRLAEDLARDGHFDELALYLKAKREAREIEDSTEPKALWLLAVKIKDGQGKPCAEGVLALDMGDAKSNPWARDLAGLGSWMCRSAPANSALAPIRSSQASRAAFKHWRGVAKSASVGEACLVSCDPSQGSVAAAALQEMSIGGLFDQGQTKEAEFLIHFGRALGQEVGARQVGLCSEGSELGQLPRSPLGGLSWTGEKLGDLRALIERARSALEYSDLLLAAPKARAARGRVKSL